MNGPFPTSLRSFLALVALCLPGAGWAKPSFGIASFLFDTNRIYAEVGFVRPDGTLHKTLAFIDLGSPEMIVSEALFKELQLDQSKPLILDIGDMPVRVDAGTITSDSWLPFLIRDNRRVEAVLPAVVMQKYEVVIDYAHRTLTLAQPGTLTPAGAALPCRVSEKTGLLVVDVSINGQSYPVTVDIGSAYTWLKKATVQEWLVMHPDWQRSTGAVGASNMRMAGDGIEATGILVRIPEITLGSMKLNEIGALGIGPGSSNWDFIDWYSQKNPVPVIGWLGGNVLRGFRITIDYPNRMTYWVRQTQLDSQDLSQVGLTLRSKDGEYYVAGVATQNGKPTVEGVQVGDKLLQIGLLHTNTATRGAIISAMHGKPGEVRTLLLQRDKRKFSVQAKIIAF